MRGYLTTLTEVGYHWTTSFTAYRWAQGAREWETRTGQMRRTVVHISLKDYCSSARLVYPESEPRKLAISYGLDGNVC
jgi:hypothetical protein